MAKMWLAFVLTMNALACTTSSRVGRCTCGAILSDTWETEALYAECQSALRTDRLDIAEEACLAASNESRWPVRRVVILNLLGVIIHKRGSPKRAADVFSAVVAIEPQYAEAHNNLGAALYELGALDEALDAFGKANEVDPYYPTAKANYGNTLVRMGRLFEARKAYEACLTFAPAEPDCLAGERLTAANSSGERGASCTTSSDCRSSECACRETWCEKSSSDFQVCRGTQKNPDDEIVKDCACH